MTITTITMSEPVTVDHLLRLQAWLSPGFPVGGFSYSHGLEQAVERGLLTDRREAAGWIGTILAKGAGWTDAVLFVHAHRAVLAGDRNLLGEIAELAAAWRGTAETALEAQAQGTAFIAALAAGWPDGRRDAWLKQVTLPSYAVAVAVATAASGIGEAAALAAYLHAVAANLVSAAVRLVPLGQTDGQRVLATLTAAIPPVVADARRTALDDLGTAAPMVDWTSMRHETQYTRLFRS